MKFKILKEDKAPIYFDDNTKKSYRWDGTQFVEISNNTGKGKGKEGNNPTPPEQNKQDSPADNKSKQKGGSPEKLPNPTRGDSQPSDRGDKEVEVPQIGDKGADYEADSEKWDSEESSETPEERDARITNIKRLFDDPDYADEIIRSTDQVVSKERGDKEARRYKNSQMQKFKDSFEQFIKQSVLPQRGTSWSKINKKYSGTGILKPGRTRMASGIVPQINVYFDQSGSWGPEDIAVGEKAVGVINNYVHRRQVVMNLFYFGNRVVSSPDGPHGGGTEGQPVLEHIKQTKPDNVVIMTDADISDCSDSVEVPGGVWFLWKNGEKSANLREHLRGKQVTREFDLEGEVQ